MITVIAGGVGAARFLAGLVDIVPPGDITTVVNVGDDTVLHGLAISPDLDTVTYTLGGLVNPTTGWGLADETWAAMDALDRFGDGSWFRLGDRDLATHLYRTGRLADGAPLSAVTAEIARGFGVAVAVTPVTDDRLRTRVTLADEGEVDFQHYFVRRRHAVEVTKIHFAGAETAEPAPGVIDAIDSAERVVIAPSNPIVSVAPVLAVPAVDAAVRARRADVVAISPIVDGRALKGPADRLMRELGFEASVVGVARVYAEHAAALVIDETDAQHADAVAAEGVRPVIGATVMDSPERASALAQLVVDGK